MSEPSYPSIPPSAPALPPAPPAKKGMSTGCIVGLIVGIVGFVGLLVVAVLAAIAIPVGKKVLEKARLLQTQASVKGLESATKSYQTEYNRFPNLGTSDETTVVESKSFVLDILTGKDTDQNPRQVQFFEFPPSSSQGKGGVITTSSGVELRDPFGNLYRMHFDWGGDGSVPDPENASATIAEPVIIYSAGPDGDYDTWEDNITSWIR